MGLRTLSRDWKLYVLLALLLLSNLGTTQKEGEEGCECDQSDGKQLSISVEPNPVELTEQKGAVVQMEIVGSGGSSEFFWSLPVTPWEGIVKSFNISSAGGSATKGMLVLEPQPKFDFEETRQTTALIAAIDAKNVEGPFRRWLTIQGVPIRIVLSSAAMITVTLEKVYVSPMEVTLLNLQENTIEVEFQDDGRRGLSSLPGLGDPIAHLLEAEVISDGSSAQFDYKIGAGGVIAALQQGLIPCERKMVGIYGADYCLANVVTQKVLARTGNAEIRNEFPITMAWPAVFTE